MEVHMPTKRVTAEVKEEILGMHEEGMLTQDIATELDLALTTTYRVLQSLGLKPNKPDTRTVIERMGPDNVSEFLERYEGDEPAIQLIADYGLTYPQMYELLEACGVQPRRRRNVNKDARAMQLEHALRLYANTDMTLAAIFEETGIHQPVLHREIHARGIPLRRPRVAEEEV
jgi:transposase